MFEIKDKKDYIQLTLFRLIKDIDSEPEIKSELQEIYDRHFRLSAASPTAEPTQAQIQLEEGYYV